MNIGDDVWKELNRDRLIFGNCDVCGKELYTYKPYGSIASTIAQHKRVHNPKFIARMEEKKKRVTWSPHVRCRYCYRHIGKTDAPQYVDGEPYHKKHWQYGEAMSRSKRNWPMEGKAIIVHLGYHKEGWGATICISEFNYGAKVATNVIPGHGDDDLTIEQVEHGGRSHSYIATWIDEGMDAARGRNLYYHLDRALLERLERAGVTIPEKLKEDIVPVEVPNNKSYCSQCGKRDNTSKAGYIFCKSCNNKWPDPEDDYE